MCGRIFIKTNLESMMDAFAFADRKGALGLSNQFPRYNGAPSLEYPIIIKDLVREPVTKGTIFVSARWGLIPRWMPPGGRPPINARCESITTNGMFKAAYRARRCLCAYCFFEWKDIFGTGKNKQPYAIAMKSGRLFALAGVWETFRDQAGIEIRAFAIVTCPANEMMAAIHDRMPVILHPEDYGRWLSPEPDPNDLMKPFSSELMTMWPIDRKVGSPKNDTPISSKRSTPIPNRH